ncbi:hypothetical protein AC579_4914 [Pseudocercospora musae]|uniref:RhoGAP-domain-containing protein n=1 Tax=Pseudocercospora musae TaxID=113226 RepID=A0A139IEQ0_9PEZI|nr:hypothetical protein AC579_4914 [Pseudocercospora musae]
MNETSLALRAAAARTTTGPSGSLQDPHRTPRPAVPAFDTHTPARSAVLPTNHTSANHNRPVQRHEADLSISNSSRHAQVQGPAQAQTHQAPRAPNPAKKVTANEKDELHSAISAQVVAEAAVKASAAASTSPPSSPTIMHSSKPATRPDRGPIMAHRTASIDSTVSSISSVASTSQRLNQANALRVAQDNQGPQDAASLIAAAGSAEEALKKVLAEKQQAANHNAQLWRLVEKQRAMILGLNKDLEKSLKEKERYRRKLKESLQSSTSAPTLITSTDQTLEGDSRETSQSPSQLLPGLEVAARDISVDTRKTSDTSGSVPSGVGRSDTPQDATNAPSSGLPATPQSASSITQGQRDWPIIGECVPVRSEESKAAIATIQRAPGETPPLSPKLVDVAYSPKASQAAGHQKNASTSSFHTSPPPSAHSFSSPKTRKAPPAPLKLDPLRPEPSMVNSIADPSDSEYEDDPESARSEFMERGRRKTREEDDREREVLAQREAEQRSRSKKEKKSKSRPAEQKTTPSAVAELPAPEPAHHPSIVSPTANPAEIIRNRAVSDAANAMQRTLTAPSGFLTPGLPMSPRPSDRPLNSPMPRAANASIASSMPMSPRSAMPGLPLSPRQPRQAIPLPPQTPMAMMSPHLDRAKAYNTQQQAATSQPQSTSSAVDRLKPSNDASSGQERPSMSSDHSSAYTPGEVYKGLVTEQYPDLLLPPNALPSIMIRTASSRMIRSRASMILPLKQGDENPVFTIGVYARSDNRELWRAEKTYAALAGLDQEVKSLCRVQDRLPEKALFTGHAPAKIDARRMALNHYFERMLDSVIEERAARIVCRFLSTDAFPAEGGDYLNARTEDSTRPTSPATPAAKFRPNMAGYLTKRGKNFGGWKARYFVLDGPNLKYFEGPGGAHLGSIKLQNAQIGKQSVNPNQSSHEDEDNQFRHAFLVLEPKKKDSSSLVRHVLCAESDDERDSWVDALLHYVDFRDEEESQQPGRQAQMFKTEISAPRSPRLQKSMNDLRPGSSKDVTMDALRAVGYGDTVAGDAPVMGPPATPRVTQTPSPPYDKLTSGADVTSGPHPLISGPTNLQVIQNTGDWGMKVPPTPGRDKKRSMFQIPFSRGRSSSDLDFKDSAKTSTDRGYARAVFGVPLAEAAEFSRPDGIDTHLPSVVYRCIQYLTAKNAVAEEGIFRLSGSNTVIRALKDRFNTEGDVDLLSDENYYDVHAVASLLKLYLRELPASILTRDLHLDFLHCLEMHGEEKILALNSLVNKLPTTNRALLEAMSSFMLLIVNNVEVNRMNVRNLGVVFSPTLNLPGPLISLFVEEQARIFDATTPAADSPSSVYETQPPEMLSGDLRSPRKQMFQDLPTPAYNQTQFQNIGGYRADDTGFTPMQPSYANYQMAPQGDGGFGSLNDALRSPTVYNTTGMGAPTPRDVKQRRRESDMLHVMGPTKKASFSRLREEQGTSF